MRRRDLLNSSALPCLQQFRCSIARAVTRRFNELSAPLVLWLEKLPSDEQAAYILRHLLQCAAQLLSAQESNNWQAKNAERLLQSLLHYSVDPNAKIRKVAQAGVGALGLHPRDSELLCCCCCS